MTKDAETKQGAEQAIRLLEYTEELFRMNPVRNLKKQKDHLYLREIHENPYIQLRYPDQNPETDELLSITWPEHLPAPVPDPDIAEWILNDCTDLRVQPEIVRERSAENPDTGKTETLSLDDHPDLKRRIESWQSAREQWVKEETEIRYTQSLYSSFYALFRLLEQNPETLRLEMGSGQLQFRKNPQIDHPVLLKEAILHFDPASRTITLKNSGQSSHLYKPLFSELEEEIPASQLQSWDIRSQTGEYHPFDRARSVAFLKDMVYEITDQSVFCQDPVDISRFPARIQVRMAFSPVLLVSRKENGTPFALSQIRKTIQKTRSVPAPLQRILAGGEKQEIPEPEMSFEQRLASLGGEREDMFLVLPASQEQLRIARAVRQSDTVLVQGAPGTGKTHTIINLVCDFLARGKRVLVSAPTRKGVSILKDMLPDSMQVLCGSLPDSPDRDLDISVGALLEQMEGLQPSVLDQEIAALQEERKSLLEQLTETRKRMVRSLQNEVRTFEVDGRSYTAVELAEDVSSGRDRLEQLIPGKIDNQADFPCTDSELDRLYTLLSQTDAEDFHSDFPPDLSLDAFPEPDVFSAELQKKKDLEAKLNHSCPENILEVSVADGQGVFLRPAGNPSQNWQPVDDSVRGAVEKLESFLSAYSLPGSDVLDLVGSAMDKESIRLRLTSLFSDLEQLKQSSEELSLAIGGDRYDLPEELTDLTKDERYLEYKRLVLQNHRKRILGSRKKRLLDIYDHELRKNRKPLAEAGDFAMVEKIADNRRQRNEIRKQWNDLMEESGIPLWEDLGALEQEYQAVKWKEPVLLQLDWYQNVRSSLLPVCHALSVSIEDWLPVSDLLSGPEKIEQLDLLVQSDVRRLLVFLKDALHLQSLLQQDQSACRQSDQDLRTGQYLPELMDALERQDAEAYEQAWQNARQRIQQAQRVRDLKELLDRLDACAPEWKQKLCTYDPAWTRKQEAELLKEAWSWKKKQQILDDILSESMEDLQARSADLSTRFQNITGELVPKMARRYFLERMSGIALQQPGAKMEVAQKVMPCWMMSLQDVLEYFDPAMCHFDVVILDEADQSDLRALALPCFGESLIVVGDEGQVRPAVIPDEKAESLKNRFLQDIPDSGRFDRNRSLCEIAATSVVPLQLREQVRSVPEITEYFAQRAYGGSIRPLREAGSSLLMPAVNHLSAGGGKISREEALTCIALLKACLLQPEYDGKTFGILALGSPEQGNAIGQYLNRFVPPDVVEERNIAAGEPDALRGQERDVIVLSLADADPRGGFPARQADRAVEQRIRLALGCAKDQLWVIDSLDLEADLKPGDVRRDLIEFSSRNNPVPAAIHSAQEAASPFEKEVAQFLVSHGYCVVPDVSVGGYPVDLVVRDGEKKIALECDGADGPSEPDQILEELEKQRVLERPGWKCIRIRESESVLNPEQTLQRLVKKLDDLQIHPFDPESGNTWTSLSLKERVLAEVPRQLAALKAQEPADELRYEDLLKLMNPEPETSKPERKVQTETPDARRKDSGSRPESWKPDQPEAPEEQTRKTRKPSGTGRTMRTNTVSGLIGELKSASFEVLDRTDISKLLYVFYQKGRKEELEEILAGYPGLIKSRSLEKRGTIATGNRAAWLLSIH